VIADLSEILVEAEVGEGEVVSVKNGQPAKIKVDAVMDKEYHGHVVEIGSSASQRAGASAVRFFNVKIAIDDADERLRPGMTAQVSIVTNSAPDAVIVPIQSVVERVPGAKGDESGDDDKPKKKYVFLSKNGKAKQVEVTTGISDATQVQILTGVAKGDPVISGPFRTLKSLKDGADIEVTKEEKKTTAKSDAKDKDNKDKK
jgi:HlyD family secretion protein